MSIALFWVHTASVETYQGATAYGDSFAASVDVACFANDGAHLVRSASNEEVVSQTVLYCDTGDAGLFAIDSRVTVNGRTARVISVNTNDGAGLGLPSHVEVHLT